MVVKTEVMIFYILTLCGDVGYQCFIRGSCCHYLQGEVRGAWKWTYM